MVGFFHINISSSTPIYKQIIQQFMIGREQGKIRPGEQLPSISAFAKSQNISLATVARAYDQMKALALIESRHGKGFYVAKEADGSPYNIFVLFDTLNPYKDVLYTSFRQHLPEETKLDLHFYHYDYEIFQQAVEDSLGKYSHYVILPHLNRDLSSILSKIPSEKLLLLDRYAKGIKGAHAAVYHDFEKSVMEALEEAKPLLKKYKGLDIVLDLEHEIYTPEELIRGIQSFTAKHNIPSSLHKGFQPGRILPGKSYLIFSDNDLVSFIKFCKGKKWKIGKDIGLIGYDETPMKEILLNGITVISTDFSKMGETAANLIMGNRKEIIENPSGLIKRKTL